jgi:DNA-binding MarR family transcriptional regulator
MGDLAKALDVTPRSITALVDGLESEGLVRRVAHPTDRRATIVELEPGAIDVEAEYREHAETVARLFADLSDADRAALFRIVRTLEGRLRD